MRYLVFIYESIKQLDISIYQLFIIAYFEKYQIAL